MKIFYCDGSTRGMNQKGASNIGGWGVVCLDRAEDDSLELISFDYDSEECTTNNRQELKAMIYCLSTIKELYENEKAIIYSDSAYVVNICQSWIYTWAANDWKNSKKQTVENLDLIQELYQLLNYFFIAPDIRKCAGHSGEIGNELADALAQANLNRFLKLVEEYDLELGNSDYEWIQRRIEEEQVKSY